MAGKDQDLKETLDQDSLTEGHSFDELAKGIASGALSRGQLLKLAGAAVLGSVLSGALPGVALAKKKKKKKKHHHRPPAPILSPPPPTCNTGEALCGTGAAATCCATDPNTGCGCFTEVGGQSLCLATNALCSTPCSVPSDCPTGSTCADIGVPNVQQKFCTCTSNSDCPNSSVCVPIIGNGEKLCIPLCTNGVPNSC